MFDIKEIAVLAIALVVYALVGGKIIKKALRNIKNGQVFDENFLMVVASLGSLILGEYAEGVMVMLLYRIGEYMQNRAVGKSRRAIADLMDIRPDYANVDGENGELVQVDPEDLEVGTVITVKPGERVPVDGIIIEGSSRLDTAALTGESVPRSVGEGDEIYSGVINLNGVLRVRVTKPCSESTATRILELIEEAADSKASAENFITKFARYYTPIVCGLALALAVIPPIIAGSWSVWIYRALTFLVVSCPCALVISIPLGFFGGIGGASSKGILIKGGNYLEALSMADTVVFDKPGTLTKGIFSVVAVHPEHMEEEQLLELATLAESFSDHPISRSLADEYKRVTRKKVDKARVASAEEFAGEGIIAIVDGKKVAAGNSKLMKRIGAESHECHLHGTTVHVSIDDHYEGHIIISDVVKEDSKSAIEKLKALGVKKTVMLTGDKAYIASDIAADLNLDEHHAELMPQDKVSIVETLLAKKAENRTLAFVGDGINDAPVLARADVGIAMGSMGSSAAVEAADIVLMNDKPSDVALAVKIARKTMGIVYQNIVLSIGIKVAVLILAAFGIANMWLAIFADTGVCMLAILNSMRCLRISDK
ncbi:MAG: cadmium-translocating P-type ATPase [Clostridia bacterium]|nr:cadmium-translocating P-type ATPase [Clostridia bacterium]